MMLALFLLLLASSALAGSVAPEGAVAVEELVLSAPEREWRLTFAVFAVPTAGPLHIRRHNTSGGSAWQSRPLVPDGSAQGLTRMKCGLHHLFESTPLPRRARDARDLPVYLIPLHQNAHHGPADELDAAVSVLEQRHARRDQQPHKSSLQFALLVHSVRWDGVRGAESKRARGVLAAAGQEALGRRELDDWLATCQLLFLPPESQLAFPPGSYATGPAPQDTLQGKVAKFSVTDFPPQPRRDAAPALASLAALAAARLHATAPREDSGRDSTCTFDPRGDIFLSVEETAASTSTLGAMVRGPGGPLFGLISKAISPVVDMVAKGLHAPIAQHITYWEGDVAKNCMSDDISTELVREIPPQVAQALIPAVTAIVPDQLTPQLSRVVADYLTESLSSLIGNALNEHLTPRLSVAVSDRVLLMTPPRVAQLIGIDLGVALSKAVVHALVPALVHTLSHQPLSDYFCYYCFHQQLYCEYCQYAPSQVYWASYYAGYFSSYYSPYYNIFFKQLSQAQLERAIDVQNHKAALDERFEEVAAS